MSNQSAGMQPPASEAELNRQAYRKLLDELYARQGCSGRRTGSARKKHRERGKLLARERIDVLIDPGSRFSSWPSSRAKACMRASLRVPA